MGRGNALHIRIKFACRFGKSLVKYHSRIGAYRLNYSNILCFSSNRANYRKNSARKALVLLNYQFPLFALVCKTDKLYYFVILLMIKN